MMLLEKENNVLENELFELGAIHEFCQDNVLPGYDSKISYIKIITDKGEMHIEDAKLAHVIAQGIDRTFFDLLEEKFHSLNRKGANTERKR